MNIPQLNALDAVILVALLWNIIRGFSKGVIEEIMSILGIIISIVLALNLHRPVATLLLKTENYDPSAGIIVGFVIYLVSFLIFKYIAFNLTKLIKLTPLGIFNNILGLLFGIVRGLAIASIFVLGTAMVSPENYLIKKSHLGGITVPLIDKAISLMPKSTREHLEENWSIAREYLLENFKEWIKNGEEKVENKVRGEA
ncbi:MAG: CvpA family protein [Desulfurobacteriaceae bacterium]